MVRIATLKKLRIAAVEEFGRETNKFLEFARLRLRRDGASNTEWIENGLKAALFADARAMVEGLLNDPQVEVTGSEKLPGEKRGGVHDKVVQSMFGAVRLRREYFYHAERGCGRYPMDEALGLETVIRPHLCA